MRFEHRPYPSARTVLLILAGGALLLISNPATGTPCDVASTYGRTDLSDAHRHVELTRNIDGGRRRSETALGLVIHCTDSLHGWRLDLGVTHEAESDETTGFARIIAGGPFPFGHWHAGALRGMSGNAPSYFGSAILNNELTPLAIEARWESDDGIWKTLFSAGLYLFTTDSMELALGFAQLDGEDPRRRLMLKLSGDF